ncbi:MAG: hypothetical protein SPH80_05900 [Peptoniphilaceae bacterium]|nr:hypothetical protein [Peptoniphilaceae bacterium]MDY6147054.1 hypothetical protein [Peptoniphilaceae bacterium]
MHDIQNVYSDFIDLLKKTALGIPVLLSAGAVYGILQLLFYPLLGVIAVGAGSILVSLMRWILQLAFFSFFAGLMLHLLRYHSLRLDQLKRWDTSYIGPLSQIFFLLWIVEVLFGLLPLPSEMKALILLIWHVFTAPAFEAVYFGNVYPQNIFSFLTGFWSDNYLAILPFAVAVILVSQFRFTGSFLLRFLGPGAGANYIILGIAEAFYLYLKGVLFSILFNSTPRSREFRRRASH